MKLNSLAVASLAAGCMASSFENSAPLLVSASRLGSGEYRYLSKAENAEQSIEQLTREFCASAEGQNLLYLRIEGLDSSDVSSEFVQGLSQPLAKYSDHVVYSGKEQKVPVSAACESLRISGNGVKDEQWLSELLKSTAQVNVVDLSKKSAAQLAQSLKKLSVVYAPETLVIQGLPTFEEAGSIMDLAAGKLKGYSKRSGDEESEAELEQEMDEALAELDELAKEAEESLEADNEFYIQSTSSKSKDDKKKGKTEAKKDSKKGKKKDKGNKDNADEWTPPEGSLFDQYSFVTSGIWMGVLVSGALLWILYIAFTWLNSIQISYGAFEKQVTPGKKTQ